MKIRAKSVEKDAVQFLEGYFDSVPEEFRGAVCMCDGGATFIRPHIHTLEGTHWITVGDWIIKGLIGEFYPCKPDVFEKTYDIINA